MITANASKSSRFSWMITSLLISFYSTMAAYIINGNCKNVMNMSQSDQEDPWNSVMNEPERPWNLKIYFRGYPSNILIPCEGEDSVKWSFVIPFMLRGKRGVEKTSCAATLAVSS